MHLSTAQVEPLTGITLTEYRSRVDLQGNMSGRLRTACRLTPATHVATVHVANFQDNSRPSFVGNDYYCEAAIHGIWEPNKRWLTDHRLWDGHCSSESQCCLQQTGAPYFTKSLGTSTTENLEVRLCANGPTVIDWRYWLGENGTVCSLMVANFCLCSFLCDFSFTPLEWFALHIHSCHQSYLVFFFFSFLFFSFSSFLSFCFKFSVFPFHFLLFFRLQNAFLKVQVPWTRLCACLQLFTSRKRRDCQSVTCKKLYRKSHPIEQEHYPISWFLFTYISVLIRQACTLLFKNQEKNPNSQRKWKACEMLKFFLSGGITRNKGHPNSARALKLPEGVHRPENSNRFLLVQGTPEKYWSLAPPLDCCKIRYPPPPPPLDRNIDPK